MAHVECVLKHLARAFLTPLLLFTGQYKMQLKVCVFLCILGNTSLSACLSVSLARFTQRCRGIAPSTVNGNSDLGELTVTHSPLYSSHAQIRPGES